MWETGGMVKCFGRYFSEFEDESENVARDFV